ncbi:conjugal transfer protein TrbD [Shewanella colwelliana]|uniref:conjugal transfer protein TrbD n=1 Tax=Shewanella colwelliana TaxID=23 RepID=UPI0037353D6E
MSRLRRSPIFKFNRANLVLGAERELAYLLGLLTIVLIFALQNSYTLVLGIVLWFSLMPLLRMMGEADPQMSKTFKRYTKYQKYYPAHSPKNYSRKH